MSNEQDLKVEEFSEYEVGYDEGYEDGKSNSIERRRYTVQVSKSGAIYQGFLSGRIVSANEDLERMKLNAGSAINRMHIFLGLPEIGMDSVEFEKLIQHTSYRNTEKALAEKAQKEVLNADFKVRLKIRRKEEELLKKAIRASRIPTEVQLKNLKAQADAIARKLATTNTQESRRLINIEKKRLRDYIN